MPSHKTHELVGIVTTPLVFAGSLYLTQNMEFSTTLSVLYVVATYFFSPDLDIDSAPYYRWNVFSLLWYPYKQIIPHRSILSHSGPISGTIRFFYFMLWVVIIGYIFSLPILTYQGLYGILWIAIILADSVHTLLDLIWKG